MLLTEHRLRKSADFMTVVKNGRRWVGRAVVLTVAHGNTQNSRFGLAVSKRVGNAVIRNLVKRRLREILRNVSVAPGRDVIVSARPLGAKVTFKELNFEVVSLLQRARLL